MLKTLIDSWRSSRAEKKLYKEFLEMLEMAWAAYGIVTEVLDGRIDATDVADDILLRDIAINRKERAIRRQLVEHMGLHGGAAVPGSLVLMSLVKDAERLGDYCKNLMEVAQMLQGPVLELPLHAELLDVGAHVTQNFQRTMTAFADTDEDMAQEIVEDEALFNKRCDRMVDKLARSDIPAHQSVPMALWIRFHKRINAHLSNICTSLVLPVHRLDYRMKYEKKSG